MAAEREDCKKKKKRNQLKSFVLKTTSESQSDQFSKKISGGKKANLQTSTKKRPN